MKTRIQKVRMKMSSLEIADEKAALEKMFGVLKLIERSHQKCLAITTSSYYNVFGNHAEKIRDLAHQKAVTARLSNYYANLKKQNNEI